MLRIRRRQKGGVRAACQRDSVFLKRQHRRRITWIALAALLYGALAPALANAMPAFAGKAWVEICSAAGVKRIAVDASQSPLGGTHTPQKHCPYLQQLQHLHSIVDAALPNPPRPIDFTQAYVFQADAPPAALVFRDANPSHAPPRRS
jgi:hypothetical protein